MINPTDISFVITGTFPQEPLLSSIRKFFPGAEVILVLWNDDTFRGLETVDKTIYIKAPGACVFDESNRLYNNLNRILIASFEGVKASTRKYIFRLRSDLIFKNSDFLKLNFAFLVRDRRFTLFKEKIIVCDTFSISADLKSKKRQLQLFHLSDWLQFGLSEDIKNFFDLKIVEEPSFSQYFTKKYKTDIFPNRLWRMSPEQYFLSENCRKIYPNLNYKTYLDTNQANVELSERFIINNFFVYSLKELGMEMQNPKYLGLDMISIFKEDCFNNFKIEKLIERYYGYKTRHKFSLSSTIRKSLLARCFFKTVRKIRIFLN